jgi:hypothetical protein
VKLEALLHRRVHVRRHSPAGFDPHLHQQRVPVLRRPEGEPLLENRILDDVLLHAAS